jgi:hypothetical protein
MEPLAIALAAALALLILLRRPGVLSPVLVLDASPAAMTVPAPGEEEDQLPETDRAPRRWLPWSVAAVAALRLVLLVTLHA